MTYKPKNLQAVVKKKKCRRCDALAVKGFHCEDCFWRLIRLREFWLQFRPR